MLMRDAAELVADTAMHDGTARQPPDRAQPKPPSPAVTRFLTRLDPDLAGSFSAEQLAAIDLHFGMRYRHHHLIDWRIRLPLPFSASGQRAYVVLLAGTDRAAP